MNKKELVESLSKIEEFKRLIMNIPNEYQSVSTEIEMCQSEITDILHDIEFSKLDRTSASRKAKYLQKVQRKRRENKEMQELLHMLNIFFLNNKKIIPEINKVQSQIKSILNKQDNRIYSPRNSQTSMEAAFMHFNAKDESLDWEEFPFEKKYGIRSLFNKIRKNFLEMIKELKCKYPREEIKLVKFWKTWFVIYQS